MHHFCAPLVKYHFRRCVHYGTGKAEAIGFFHIRVWRISKTKFPFIILLLLLRPLKCCKKGQRNLTEVTFVRGGHFTPLLHQWRVKTFDCASLHGNHSMSSRTWNSSAFLFMHTHINWRKKLLLLSQNCYSPKFQCKYITHPDIQYWTGIPANLWFHLCKFSCGTELKAICWKTHRFVHILIFVYTRHNE